MTKIILGLSLLVLFATNHYVAGQDSKPTTLMTSTTWTSIFRKTGSTTKSTSTSEKEGFETIDPYQDILFDPSLVVARVNRDVSDVSNEESSWSVISDDAKDEEDSSNILEDLNTQEDRHYSGLDWYRRRDWQVEEERPTYKKESYNRFLKYPIFSGR